jgi:hypothetical protein
MVFSTKSPFSNQNLRKSPRNSQLSHQVDQSNTRHFVASQRSAMQASIPPVHHTGRTPLKKLLDSFVLELVLHSVSVRLGKVGCSLGRLLKLR